MNQPRSCGGRFARVYSDDCTATSTPYFSIRLFALGLVKQDELDVRRDAIREVSCTMEARCANISNRWAKWWTDSIVESGDIPEGISRVVADSRAILKV